MKGITRIYDNIIYWLFYKSFNRYHTRTERVFIFQRKLNQHIYENYSQGVRDAAKDFYDACDEFIEAKEK